MKFSCSFEGEGEDSISELPRMGPRYTAATTANHRRAAKAHHHRVALQDDDATVASHAQSHGGYGADNSCISGYSTADDMTMASNGRSCVGSYISLADGAGTDSADCSSVVANKQNKKESHRFCLSLALENILGEEGIFEDTMKSFKQVLYAFVISPDDIDGMAATIQDARDEIIEKELDRTLSALKELKSRH